jgi:cell division protein FtsL
MALRALVPPLSSSRPTRAVKAVNQEVFLQKRIDNSRMRRLGDPGRNREMAMFAAATLALLIVVMVYAWQHFSAVEYGYRIEQLRAQRDALIETNRALRLEEASLRDPERIDLLARQMGLATPEAGQVVRLEPQLDPGMPVLAQVTPAEMTAR